MLEMVLRCVTDQDHSAVAEGGAVKPSAQLRVAGSCGRRLHTSRLCIYPTVQSWEKMSLRYASTTSRFALAVIQNLRNSEARHSAKPHPAN